MLLMECWSEAGENAELMRNLATTILVLFTLVAGNIPTAQCSITGKIAVGQASCSAMRMLATNTDRGVVKHHSSPMRCPMGRSGNVPCHMTLIHKGWNTGPVIIAPPAAATSVLVIPTTVIQLKPSTLHRGYSRPLRCEHSPPILATKCTLNI